MPSTKGQAEPLRQKKIDYEHLHHFRVGTDVHLLVSLHVLADPHCQNAQGLLGFHS